MKPKPNHEYIVRMGNDVDFDWNIPIASVKELVRCKDCVLRDMMKYCFVVKQWVQDDDFFCAVGERKECEQDAD